MVESSSPERKSKWTFLTNHSHVLLCLARDKAKRMRDIAFEVGITERAVQRIIAELVEEGFLVCKKDGRCNQYSICLDRHLRHPLESHRTIIDLIRLIHDDDSVIDQDK